MYLSQLRRTLSEYAARAPREAAMYAMPMNVARQLVADRRVSYERIATRRRIHLTSRRAARAAAARARVPSPPAALILLPHDGSPERAPEAVTDRAVA
jgi:hypothetical protein